ncbi:MAG: NAD-dependent epimerase/dehydratase family protein [Micromonosporaceae bacterium]|nr:NAD-dependent epimerase/dehydratase family protein [Micromonosporaceae bacterium]
MPETVLVTGAAGKIGTAMRNRMARSGRLLRLLDIAPMAEPADGEAIEIVCASAVDLDAMTRACDGADAVVHLASHAAERSWDEIVGLNIQSTYVVLEAARRAGTPRVVFASSNHAVGFCAKPSSGVVGDYVFPRPDTYYGVAKVTGEALGSLYHDRYGLDVICLRIGSCRERPVDERMLATWLSYDDCARLIEASLSAPDPGFRVVWGISDNTRGWWSLDEARALGYEPRDDAEAYADQVRPAPDDLGERYVGGEFCSSELDAEIPR